MALSWNQVRLARLAINLYCLLSVLVLSYSAVTEAFAADALMTSPWARELGAGRAMVVGVVAWEMSLVVWMLTGWKFRLAWRFTLLTWFFFAIVSLRWLALGHSVCGCFGQIEIHPGITSVLDLVFVAGMASLSVFHGTEVLLPPSASLRRFASATMLVAVAAGTVSSNLHRFAPFPAAVIQGQQLQPSRWVGHSLPILKGVRGDFRYLAAKQSYDLLIVRAACDRCRDVLSERSLLGSPTYVFDLDGSLDAQGSLIAIAKNIETATWNCDVPVLVRVVHGVVKNVEFL